MLQGNLHTTPALAAPPGEKTDLVNAYSLHSHLVATASVCLVLSVLAVIGRTFTKARILKKVELEDYALIFAAAGFAAFTAVMVAAGEAGQGKHQWNVSVAGMQRIALLANILEIIYPPTMFAAKMAILLQIKHIFTQHQRNFNYWAVQTLLAANFLVYTALFFAFIFACWPREKIWNHRLPGRCIDTNASIIATSAINIISDLSILFLPLFSISRLYLAPKRKIAVSAVFAVGLFACAASGVRLYYSILLAQTKDVTWAIAPVGMWALAEFATVIIVGCFPTLPRLWKFIRGTDSGKSSYSSGAERKTFPSKSGGLSNKRREWYDGVTTTEFGTYIPLEERKFPPNTEHDHQVRVVSDHGPLYSGSDVGIQKRTDIELVRGEQRAE